MKESKSRGKWRWEGTTPVKDKDDTSQEMRTTCVSKNKKHTTALRLHSLLEQSLQLRVLGEQSRTRLLRDVTGIERLHAFVKEYGEDLGEDSS